MIISPTPIPGFMKFTWVPNYMTLLMMPKLSIMPGQVIGSALERILYYEDFDKRITHRLENDIPLEEIVVWNYDKTNIDFINPGTTNVFNIDVKREALATKFDDFKGNIEKVLRPSSYEKIINNHKILMDLINAKSEKNCSDVYLAGALDRAFM